MRRRFQGACQAAVFTVLAATPAIAQPGGMMGGAGMMGGKGPMASPARHRQAMMGGVPSPYASMRNPAPITFETLSRGSAVYGQNCAGCHGSSGQGEGAAGKGLSPPPANLVWISQMPMSRWDAYMYWTIAEGGQAFGTAMPAFKDTLPKSDIWAVIGFIQRGLRPARTKP